MDTTVNPTNLQISKFDLKKPLKLSKLPLGSSGKSSSQSWLRNTSAVTPASSIKSSKTNNMYT
uniref:Uncharacterized protein n=1 Tax=Rhizophora mucronata TaxID=61149 RepID=A0A2P2KCV9_RHIMU